MPLEALFAVLPEAVFGAVGVYSVVQGGANKPFLVWAERDSWHAVHPRVCHVFDLNRYTEIPHPNGFVITSGHKPPALVNKGNGVHRRQVIIIFLYDVARVQIPLVDLLV